MNVKYKTYQRYKDNWIDREADLEFWVEDNFQGGIEEKIRLSVRLLAVLAANAVVANPSLLEKVADAFECNGQEHQLVADHEAETK